MIFMGMNHNRTATGVMYEFQPLRFLWYRFMCKTHLLSKWNRLKTKDPRWQVAEITIDFWSIIYGDNGNFCPLWDSYWKEHKYL